MVGGDGDWIAEGQPAGAIRETLHLGPLAKNRWHDFVMEVRFGCKGMEVRFGCKGTGYVQLWVDGQHLVDALARSEDRVLQRSGHVLEAGLLPFRI